MAGLNLDRDRLRTRLWSLATVAVGLLGLSAFLALAGMLDVLWTNFPGPVGLSGLFVTVVLAALAIGGGVVALRVPIRPALALALTALVVLRVLAVFLVDPPLVRDPAGYDRLATEVLQGRCCFDYRPMGYPILLAAAYALGLSGKVVTLVAAIAAGPLLFALGRRLADERAGVLAVYLYALAPSFELLTGVLLTEPTYATMLLAALWAMPPAALRGGALGSALGSAASGLLVGLSQYVRTTSVFLAPAFLVPMIARRAWRQAALFSLALLLALVPVIATTGGVSTSPLGGWSLLVGTNAEHYGTYSDEDKALYNSWGEEREKLALIEAVRRISADPIGFATLAVRKVHVLWSRDDYGVTFGFEGTSVPDTLRQSASLLSMLFYVAVFGAATLALWRMRSSPSQLAAVVLGILLTVAALHIFVEVQPRYHAYTVPLLILLAASLVGNPRSAVPPARSGARPDPAG